MKMNKKSEREKIIKSPDGVTLTEGEIKDFLQILADADIPEQKGDK